MAAVVAVFILLAVLGFTGGLKCSECARADAELSLATKSASVPSLVGSSVGAGTTSISRFGVLSCGARAGKLAQPSSRTCEAGIARTAGAVADARKALASTDSGMNHSIRRGRGCAADATTSVILNIHAMAAEASLSAKSGGEVIAIRHSGHGRLKMDISQGSRSNVRKTTATTSRLIAAGQRDSSNRKILRYFGCLRRSVKPSTWQHGSGIHDASSVLRAPFTTA